MNFRTILKPLILIVSFVAVAMVLPSMVAVYYREPVALSAFLYVMISTSAVCAAAFYFSRRWQITKIAVKESFVLVVLCWVMISFVGALPFYISGAIPNFSEAFFETVSGFSTTGATILTDIEVLPKSMLFWRSLTHWLGGMGIIVLAVAILPLLGVGGLQLLKAEAPGPTVDKISPRISETAKTLWGIYVGLTVVEAMLLNLAGMSYFDAFNHAFATIATGGFSPKNASVGAYNSPFIEWIVIVFMILAGMSFTLHYKIITGRTKRIFKNTELRVYLAVIVIGTIIVAHSLLYHKLYSVHGSIRQAMFQVVSILTTTGFATADYKQWPPFAQ
jgi:trk system potassium uptake protein TrkH